ncbi:AAA family ATPase [Derxia lacustris]|uniref:AAA family ATPase n=1 Tax=Derxia lacustris TaxID=764842 RepID=UPI000A171E4E|nr:AAA family ATPase [Derxia lacustris]
MPLPTLRQALTSRFPLLCIETHEEPRARALIRQLADELGDACFEWSVADGLSHSNFRWSSGGGGGGGMAPSSARREFPDTEDFEAALRFIDKEGPRGIYLLFDVHPFLGEAAVQRLLREIAFDHPARKCSLVIVGPRIDLPPEIARHALFERLPLPDLARVRDIFREELAAYAEESGAKVAGERATADRLVQQLLGLCEEDARRLLRLSIRDDGAITDADLHRVMRIKREMLADSALDVEFPEAARLAVAGMANLKRWLALRESAFRGAAPNLPTPRGVLLLGVQGGGKSLAARAIAADWKLPLARLDIGALQDKFHGETERRLRAALAAAEAMAPCVLWIDEIEKAMAQGNADADGGVGRRVLGSLLTWMAERDKPVFIAATANDIRALPPELLRKGRFDEIFFVDLPDAATRAEMFAIHLARRGLEAAGFDLPALAAACDGFSGAEIEQAVISACFEAQGAQAPVGDALVLAELRRTRPISVTMAEAVAALRAWARDRAVPA